MVKGGEELRLDHRVQQLFDATNALLSAGADTTALQVPCVDVVPMTDCLGMLGFVPNTTELLKAVAPHVKGRYDPVGGMEAVHELSNEHVEWLQHVVRAWWKKEKGCT